MEHVAQTNLQLYNQLRAQGRSLEELEVVHRAYEFLTTIYPGYYQADGKPFVAHTVGVASILEHLGLPTEFVVAGLLHNIYGNGDFGDGLSDVVTEARRRIARKEVGERIEVLIDRFRKFRVGPKNIQDISSRLDQFDQTDKTLVVIDLADCLEKYVDLGVLYYGDNRWITDVVAEHGNQLIAIAGQLGQPELTRMLTEAFEQASTAEIPNALRASNGRKYLELVVPRSCRVRLRIVLRWRLSALWQRLRRKTRIRRRIRQARSVIGRARAVYRS